VGDYLFVFLLSLLFLAIFLREDFVFLLFYLLLGVYLTSSWWSKRAIKAVTVRRRVTERVFLGEKIKVRFEVHNRGYLPIVWLQLQESLPVQLGRRAPFQKVIHLGARRKLLLEYELEGRKRGYYAVGPMKLYSGDLFGVVEAVKREYPPDHVTVYPKIVPLSKVRLPPSAPIGTLRHRQPIFEDPSRVIGKRDYVSGDSLRKVDWKVTASTGRLQVKKFETSIALDTMIFLNLNAQEYDPRTRFDATELAIVVAASLANWHISQRQAVGLAVNGYDPSGVSPAPITIPVRRRRSHLMRLLDLLARVEPSETTPLATSIRRERVSLAWGTTLLVITGSVDETLFAALLQTQRAGMNIVLILVGNVPRSQLIRERARHFGILLYLINNERDMDIWRGGA